MSGEATLEFQLTTLHSHTDTSSGDYTILFSGCDRQGDPVAGSIFGYRPWFKILYDVTGTNEKYDDVISNLKQVFRTHWLIHGLRGKDEPYYPFSNKDVDIYFEPCTKSIMGFDQFSKRYCFKLRFSSLELKRVCATILNKSTRSAAIKRNLLVDTSNIEICDNMLGGYFHI